MALSLSRASLFCGFFGVVIFCLFTISSYVHVHLLLHFRNYTTIHPMIDSGGGTGDVEVLAYVNSNLIVIHEAQELAKSSSTSSSTAIPPLVPSLNQENHVKIKEETQTRKIINSETTVPKNLKSSSSSSAVTVINEAVIKNKTRTTSTTSTTSSSSSSSKKVSSTKKTISDPMVANFTVDGWPISKSRMAPNYVNYDEVSSLLVPKKPFTSDLANDLSQPQVLIAVQSAPQNAKLRNEVRRTWGDTCRSIHQAWCSLIFVLGSLSSESENQNSSDLQSEILQESGKYGDILQENFDDSYNNLTIKSIYILKYFVSEAEDQNQFLLKTDDDSFVHLEALWDLAKSRLEKKSNNLMGYLQLGLKKHHYLPLAHKPTKSNLQKNGKWLKWLIPTYMYNKRFFPQFLSGSGYLVTKSAATCLLQKSKTIPIVHLEDVYITGLCASSCHLRREHDKGFKARPMDKIEDYKIQMSDIVLHYTTGQMDRFHSQVKKLKQLDQTVLDPSEP